MFEEKNKPELKGIVTLIKNGEVLETTDNLIVESGQDYIINRMAHTSPVAAFGPVNKLRFGRGNTAPASSNTGVETTLLSADGTIITPSQTLGTGQGAWSIQPAGFHKTYSYFSNATLAASATSMTVVRPELFPTASTGITSSHFFMQITDTSGQNIQDEIVKVTDTGTRTQISQNTAATATFTIQRAQQSTTARDFLGPSGSAERNTVHALTPRNTHYFTQTYTGTASDDITEAVLLASFSGPGGTSEVCVSRVVFNSTYSRTQNDNITIVWDIRFT